MHIICIRIICDKLNNTEYFSLKYNYNNCNYIMGNYIKLLMYIIYMCSIWSRNLRELKMFKISLINLSNTETIVHISTGLEQAV